MMQTTTSPRLNSVEAFAEMARRRIGLTSAFNGRIWVASIEQVRNKKLFTKADMVVISAAGPTPIAAIEALLDKLDNTPQATALFEEEQCPW